MAKHTRFLLAAALAFGVSVSAHALPLLAIDIQPIQVCDDGGNNCANSGMQLFEDIGDKIWAQADIDLNFLPWQQVDDSNILDAPNHNAYDSNANPNILNLWFLNTLADCGGVGSPATLYGCGGANRVSVTELIFSFNGGIGRLDTIAHEIGHVLGLGHNDFGAGNPDNVMTGGGTRAVPGSIDDVNPDGLGLSKLTDEQIAEARDSGVLYRVIPEPGSLLLVISGSLLACRRRAS